MEGGIERKGKGKGRSQAEADAKGSGMKNGSKGKAKGKAKGTAKGKAKGKATGKVVEENEAVGEVAPESMKAKGGKKRTAEEGQGSRSPGVQASTTSSSGMHGESNAPSVEAKCVKCFMLLEHCTCIWKCPTCLLWSLACSCHGGSDRAPLVMAAAAAAVAEEGNGESKEDKAARAVVAEKKEEEEEAQESEKRNDQDEAQEVAATPAETEEAEQVEFAGRKCSQVLVENFNSLTTHEQQQLADKWQLSPEEAYWRIIEVLKTCLLYTSPSPRD